VESRAEIPVSFLKRGPEQAGCAVPASGFSHGQRPPGCARAEGAELRSPAAPRLPLAAGQGRCEPSAAVRSAGGKRTVRRLRNTSAAVTRCQGSSSSERKDAVSPLMLKPAPISDGSVGNR